MNFSKNTYFHYQRGHMIDWRVGVRCHRCGQNCELGDLVIDGNAVHCLFCGTHLGYLWDFPNKIQKILKRI